MVFNSIEFLIFLPIVVLLFYLLPHKWRWLMLLAASCVFYMWFVPKYILILLVTIVIDYSAGILMERYADQHKLKKTFFVISIVSTLAVLLVFKYLNFLTANLDQLCASLGMETHLLTHIILPIGLSFHTFQSMSYVIEVYRGHQQAERHFGYYALYVMFFPQLVTGPIERPGNLMHQLHEKKEFRYENISKGMRLILFGFFVKMVVADHLGEYVDEVYGHLDEYNSWSVLGCMFFYSFQIYCDFFGYSTIALGSAKLMGFDLMDNFRSPYLSKNIAEFWHRWHISLSTWFRDYVYIPLGGSRVKFGRWAFNILVVFVLSGIWHGAAWTFLLWGFAHGLLHILEKALRNRFPSKESQSKWVRISVDALCVLKTFVLVTLFWVVFRATDLEHLKAIFVTAFTNFGGGEQMSVKPGMWIYLGLFILSDIVLRNTRFDAWCEGKPMVVRWLIYAVLVFMVIACSSVKNFPFIYFQF
ncbi:MAG: membrane bound O-acyl transferase MBOAT family protein [bacterium F082]|nr:MAG: membrane bound O-acyl transferase MBOAT family protein [bacterium F082]KWW30377.1 MAG: membrane bound O-acyl transferase MBOAT family protein [bacterium P201]